MRMKHARVPVVTAPFGITFGGGAEITLGGDRVCAAAETYMGLVEVGVGLIPAGGGHVNMLERVLEGMDEPVALQPPVPAQGVQGHRAGQGRDLGRGGPRAQVPAPLRPRGDEPRPAAVDAKRMAIALAEEGYRPPLPRKFNLPGREGIATIQMLLHNMKIAHWISSHDAKIATHVGNVLCGGDTTINNPVSEETILDLEREAFLSLCGEPKSQERISTCC